MKQNLIKLMRLTKGLFTAQEIRAVTSLLSNKNKVYNNYYMELGK